MQTKIFHAILMAQIFIKYQLICITALLTADKTNWQSQNYEGKNTF